MLTILLPSKGRPDKAKEAVDCFRANQSGLSQVVLVLNKGEDYALSVPTIHVDAHSLGEALNLASREIDTRYIGFMGDDHLIRTKEFDRILIEKLQDHPIVYGDDLLQREKLSSQFFLENRIVKTLGYMAIPGLKHMYFDNFMMELGAFYVPEVVIEHMHYSVGKSSEDDGYRRVNNSEVHGADQAVFNQWKTTQKEKDLERIYGV